MPIRRPVINSGRPRRLKNDAHPIITIPPRRMPRASSQATATSTLSVHK
jgi:hypothetical protein